MVLFARSLTAWILLWNMKWIRKSPVFIFLRVSADLRSVYVRIPHQHERHGTPHQQTATIHPSILIAWPDSLEMPIDSCEHGGQWRNVLLFPKLYQACQTSRACSFRGLSRLKTTIREGLMIHNPRRPLNFRRAIKCCHALRSVHAEDNVLHHYLRCLSLLHGRPHV